MSLLPKQSNEDQTKQEQEEKSSYTRLNDKSAQDSYTKIRKPNSLLRTLEQQLEKSKKLNGNESRSKMTPGKSASNSGWSHPDLQPLVMHPVNLDSDDEESVTTDSSLGTPNVVFSQPSSEPMLDCKEQLLKDGYRLDELSDDEDLDLILPVPSEDRCACCNVTSNCLIS